MSKERSPAQRDSGESNVQPTTLELLDRWHSGDQGALVPLIERHAPWLRRFVSRQMTDKMRRFDTSEDVVQSILFNLLRYTPPFRPENERQFRALIARVVRNRMCELHDSSTRLVRDPDRTESFPSSPSRIGAGSALGGPPDRVAAEQEERGFVLLALQLIEPDARRVIVLREFESRSFLEIAAFLSIGEEAARSRHRRALHELKSQVERLKSGQLRDLENELGGE